METSLELDLPAAHSMDNSWFAVDRDGNVGAFETHEEGPRPFRYDFMYGSDPGFDPYCKPLDVSDVVVSDQPVPSRRGMPAGQEWSVRLLVPNPDDVPRVRKRIGLERAVGRPLTRMIPMRGASVVFARYVRNKNLKELIESGTARLCWRIKPDPPAKGAIKFEFDQGIYRRTALPDSPLRLSDAPPELRHAYSCVRFHDICFADMSVFQPVKRIDCAQWDRFWLDEDEKRMHGSRLWLRHWESERAKYLKEGKTPWIWGEDGEHIPEVELTPPPNFQGMGVPLVAQFLAADAVGRVAVLYPREHGAMPREATFIDQRMLTKEVADELGRRGRQPLESDQSPLSQEAQASLGLYPYWHQDENQLHAPFHRMRVPSVPMTVDDLPSVLREAALKVRFNSLRFEDSEYIQPIEHLPCFPLHDVWISSDHKTMRPTPGLEANFVLEDWKAKYGHEYDVSSTSKS